MYTLIFWNTLSLPGWHRNVWKSLNWLKHIHICLNICRKCWRNMVLISRNEWQTLGLSWLNTCATSALFRMLMNVEDGYPSLISVYFPATGIMTRQKPQWPSKTEPAGSHIPCTSPVRFWASFSSFLAFCQAVFAQSAWDLCSAQFWVYQGSECREKDCCDMHDANNIQ